MKQHSYYLIERYCTYTHTSRKPGACLIVLWTLSSQLANCTKPPAGLCVTIFSPVFSPFFVAQMAITCYKGDHEPILFCCRFLYSGLWMVGHILTWCWTGSGFCVVHKIFTHRGIHKAVNISRTASLFSQTICRLLGFHWRFEFPWWWYFDYVQIPTLMASGKLRAILFYSYSINPPLLNWQNICGTIHSDANMAIVLVSKWKLGHSVSQWVRTTSYHYIHM